MALFVGLGLNVDINETKGKRERIGQKLVKEED